MMQCILAGLSLPPAPAWPGSSAGAAARGAGDGELLSPSPMTTPGSHAAASKQPRSSIAPVSNFKGFVHMVRKAPCAKVMAAGVAEPAAPTAAQAAKSPGGRAGAARHFRGE